ncbi:MAG: hypothetical protein VR72_10265 [Clostridiaceae bacterium BRH_c20a]|nr:MAG: hypothetical protein VR72_10265 [Clostridiaceae bacterium BRH_c20a]
MDHIKKIIIILSILIIISLSLSACDRVFQVKRIDDGQTQEKADGEQKEPEEEEVLKEQPEQKQDQPEQKQDQDQEVATAARESEKSARGNNNAQEEALSGDKEKEEVEALAISQGKGEGVLSYLLLTDTYKENQLGSMKLVYPVGEGHFVHLLAGYYDQRQNPLTVNISWEDYQGTIIYKEERKEIEADSFGFYNIYSLLGLTKRVPGQDKLPDAIGDYWVIIDIGEKIISKTKFSIIGEGTNLP